jgi:hypothetical protein
LDFFKEDEPIAICVGTWSAEFVQEYWGDIEKEYYNLTDVGPKIGLEFPKRCRGWRLCFCRGFLQN